MKTHCKTRKFSEEDKENIIERLKYVKKALAMTDEEFADVLGISKSALRDIFNGDSMEMLTGTTVYGQAGKCREMMDLLRENEILAIFEKNTTPANVPQGGVDIADQISKLATLKEQGILSDEEFAAKKAELLAKM